MLTWLVWKDNKLVGWVVARNEWEAYTEAAKEHRYDFYIESLWKETKRKTVSA